MGSFTTATAIVLATVGAAVAKPYRIQINRKAANFTSEVGASGKVRSLQGGYLRALLAVPPSSFFSPKILCGGELALSWGSGQRYHAWTSWASPLATGVRVGVRTCVRVRCDRGGGGPL
jgi:hypothetical protein